MKGLPIADSLSLPADEAITQKYGFIGRSGSGKSYAAMRLAELFLKHDGQIIALDWVGIWWSLRLAENGKDAGFKHVYIFGGEHADIELRPESGALMADLVVDRHISVVLDVMHFRKAERTRFATAFAEQFFHRKKTARTACHLFIEEAQAYLPQMVRGDEARMVGVFEDIGKVGRNYGIGNSLISQRPQAINKDVLNQVEVLLAFQTNGPQERKAIAGWTAENTTSGAAMIQELPKLDVGHALVWSPQWLRVASKVHITERITYDASSTPPQQSKAIKPKVLEPADLALLGEQMAATIEKAKADDTRELRKKISELERQLRAVPVASPPAEPVFTSIVTDDDRALIRECTAKTFADLEAVRQVLDGVFVELGPLKRVADAIYSHDQGTLRTVKTRTNYSETIPSREKPSRKPQVKTGDGDRSIGNGAFRKMLVALAQAGRPLADNQVAARAGMALSGTFDKYLGQQRTSGWVDGPRAALTITDAGLQALGRYDPLPTGVDLQDYWLGYVGGGKKREMLAVIIAAYPRPLPDSTVAERADMALSGTFDKYLGQLRTLQLVTGPRSALVASEELFN